MKLTKREIKDIIDLLEESDPYETVDFANNLFDVLGIKNRVKWTAGYFEKESSEGWDGWHPHEFDIIEKDPN